MPPETTADSRTLNSRITDAAEELRRAFEAGVDPTLSHESANVWVLACESLLASSHLDVYEHSVRALHAGFPDLRYARSMVTVLDRLPSSSDPPLPFKDDTKADVQVATRDGSRGVLIAFCGINQRLGMPLDIIHCWLGRLPVSTVYVRDTRNYWGADGFASFGLGRQVAVEALKQVISQLGADQVFVYGHSSGVYSALYYGLRIGAKALLSLGGVVNLESDLVSSDRPVPRSRLSIKEQFPDYIVDHRAQYEVASCPPKVILVHGQEYERDAAQAREFTGSSYAEIISVAGCNRHDVVIPLIERDQYQPLLDRFLALGG